MTLLRIALPPPLFVAEPLTPHVPCVPDSAPCCAPFFPKLAVPLSPYLGVRLDLPPPLFIVLHLAESFAAYLDVRLALPPTRFVVV